ncbi:ECs_2282 family putative zinc-binding protein [Xenorhabdus bovienii]|uniref:ECs_2282 family putative zinc-binding protein n=2 Tax=Xenorhabdus bovienii TaxID=40576 RepID=UPI003BA8691D
MLIMSELKFKCPGCRKDLVVRSSVDIKKVDDINGTKCSSCGRAISKDDIAKQVGDLVKNRLRDAFKKSGF